MPFEEAEQERRPHGRKPRDNEGSDAATVSASQEMLGMAGSCHSTGREAVNRFSPRATTVMPDFLRTVSR